MTGSGEFINLIDGAGFFFFEKANIKQNNNNNKKQFRLTNYKSIM